MHDRRHAGRPGPGRRRRRRPPVEDYASYDPQTTCAKKAKPGTVALGEYLVATYGGGGGAVSRPCSGSGSSEHKDGRAVDWVLNADDPADRELAKAFLAAAFATDAEGTRTRWPAGWGSCT